MTVPHRRSLLLAGLLLTPAFAFAHPGHPGGDAVAGLLHPLTGADHLAALLAVGAWSATLGGRQRVFVPLVFLLAMAGGSAIAPRLGIGAGVVEQGIAVSLLLLGLLCASRRQLPAATSLGLAAAFALFHGAAHGLEGPGGVAALGYTAGFLATSTALIACGFLACRALFARRRVEPQPA